MLHERRNGCDHDVGLGDGCLRRGIGASLGCVQPTMLSMLHHCTAVHRRADALAMRLMLINASNVATPVLFGATGAVLGVSGVFWIIGAVLGIGSRFSVGLRGLSDACAGDRKFRSDA